MYERFTHINNRFAILAREIPEDMWEQPAAATPEWSFRQLVEHIIGNNYATAAALVGIEQPATNDGVPILTALHASTEAADQAAAGETYLERTVRNQYGDDMSVDQLLRMGMTDRGLHYWDLAVSLGRPADDYLSDEDARTVYAFVEPTVEEMRKLKVFGPEVPVPLNASIQHRLLGLTGRDPAFTRQ